MPHFSHPQKKQHTYIHIREREIQRDLERDQRTRGRGKRVLRVRYKSDVRKFFVVFFARQRGESKLERDSEMVRR